MKEKNQCKVIDIEEKRKSLHKLLLRLLISFLFVLFLFSLTFCLEVFGPMNISLSLHKLRVLSDSFFIGGIIPVLFWLLVWVNEKGAFDLLSFSVKKIWSSIFRSNKNYFVGSYYDYVSKRRKNAKAIHYEVLIIGGISLLLGVMFALLSLSYEASMIR